MILLHIFVEMQCIFGYPLYMIGYGYQTARSTLTPWSHRWYDRIDDALLLGDQPTRAILEELASEEGVGLVVNLSEYFEGLDEADYVATNTHHMHVPVARAPMHVLFEVVGVIEAYRARNISTYVHDTDQGAAVALAWLAFRNRGVSLEELQERLSGLRYQVPSDLHNDVILRRFYNALSS